MNSSRAPRQTYRLTCGGHVVSAQVESAITALSRMKGLLFEDAVNWGNGRALWIKPCASIHTIGMRFAIDVLFLDRSMKVVRRFDGLVPNRITGYSLRTHSVVEFTGGHLMSLPFHVEVGSELSFEMIEGEAP